MYSNCRNSNIELLRFCMMVGLCFWHILMHGCGLKNFEVSNSSPSDLQIVALGLLAPIVDCFAFISGFFGIKLRKEKVITLFIQASFFYLMCIVIRNIFHIGQEISHGYILTNLLPITNQAWWYLIWYFFIMFLSPIIDNGITAIGKTRFLKILLVLLLINSFGTWLNRIHTGSDLAGLLSIYLLGRYLKLFGGDINFFKSIIVFVITTSLSICLLLFTYHMGKLYITWNLLMFCSPLVIIQAVSLFYVFHSLRPIYLRWLNYLGAHCFAIYLFTEFSDNVLYHWWTQVFDNYGLAVLTIMIIVVCVLVCLVDSIRAFICKPVTSFIIKTIENNETIVQ